MYNEASDDLLIGRWFCDLCRRNVEWGCLVTVEWMRRFEYENASEVLLEKRKLRAVVAKRTLVISIL